MKCLWQPSLRLKHAARKGAPNAPKSEVRSEACTWAGVDCQSPCSEIRRVARCSLFESLGWGPGPGLRLGDGTFRLGARKPSLRSSGPFVPRSPTRIRSSSGLGSEVSECEVHVTQLQQGVEWQTLGRNGLSNRSGEPCRNVSTCAKPRAENPTLSTTVIRSGRSKASAQQSKVRALPFEVPESLFASVLRPRFPTEIWAQVSHAACDLCSLAADTRATAKLQFPRTFRPLSQAGSCWRSRVARGSRQHRPWPTNGPADLHYACQP